MDELVKKEQKKVPEDVLRAVYALNMCTVSVSQIIDYNDEYILEQEYEAILNNLNLEKMPKADALKKILIELLNTITFFRIQEIRKDSIEKKYQQNMKNAIWSAIPNLSVIVSGNPVAIAVSLATQVGMGYMNYRKQKNEYLSEKEREELELRITAIEQFHALRRELFTTAWELAEEYEFDDELRLTERQIKQYNQVLMDKNELRKYVRLESMQDKFKAFPPFWYHFGHTASYIAGDSTLPLEEWERDNYRERAKKHFEHYEELNKYNILREDQMTAAFALEYVDLLLTEETLKVDKISKLISVADNMSGTAWDIKQLCAIAYLKVGNTIKAAEILKQLVNEEYNVITNAKLLSRIYVSQYLKGDSKTAQFDYKTLEMRVGEEKLEYLFPMPKERLDDKQQDEHLQMEYLVNIKTLLITDYNEALNQFLRKYTVLFNSVVPAPYGYDCFEEYYGYNEKAIKRRWKDMDKILNDVDNKDKYLGHLASVGFRVKFIDLLNEALEACDELRLWKESENHDLYVKYVRANVVQKKTDMKNVQEQMDSKSFSIKNYETIQRDLSFRVLLGKMFDELKHTITDVINEMHTTEEIESAEYNLVEFCQKHEITLAETCDNKKEMACEILAYLDYSLLGTDGIDEQQKKAIAIKKKQLVQEASTELVVGNTNEVTILLPDNKEFELYFKNKKLDAGLLREKTLLVIDDNTKEDCDLLFVQNQFIVVKRNKIKSYHSYNTVNYSKSEKYGECIETESGAYINKNINIGRLFRLIDSLAKTEKETKQ